MAITNELSLAERDKRRKHVIASIPVGELRAMWKSEMGRMASYLDSADLKKEIFDRWPEFSERIHNWFSYAWEE